MCKHSFYVYEVEYPEDGGSWVVADSEDQAKRFYNEATGFPMSFDMLEALEASDALESVEELEAAEL